MKKSTVHNVYNKCMYFLFLISIIVQTFPNHMSNNMRSEWYINSINSQKMKRKASVR